jgi:hypothetical protein
MPKLELLETRVLLSAVDAPSEFTPETSWNGAIHSTGGQISVDLLPYNKVLIISGSGHGNLEIDLSHLPSSVANLQISSFDSVTMIGDHAVSSLLVTNVHDVNAGRLAISDMLAARNVGHVKIDAAPITVLLQGDGTWGTIGDKTLFESDHISNTIILSYLKNLGVMSKDSIDYLGLFSGDPTANVLFNSQPKKLDLNGIDAQSRQVFVIKGDFAGYFLASPAERSALEQSSLVARQTAISNLVPFSTLLNKAGGQAVLGSLIDSSSIPNVRLRTAGELEFAGLTLEVLVTQPQAGDTAAIRSHVAIFGEDRDGFIGGRAANISTEKADVPPAGAERAAASDFVAFVPISHVETAGSVQPIAMLSLALTRLANPFVQTVSDLQDHLATFGEIVTVQVATQMRADGRPALLVDARNAARERDMQEITVVSI